MGSEDIVDQAVTHVLERPGYAGGMVVLDERQADDLVQPFGDNLPEVRSKAAVVLRVLPAPTSVELDEFVGIVAGDQDRCHRT